MFNKGTVFTQIAKNTLKSKGITEVYIQKIDQESLNSYDANKIITKESVLDDPIKFKNYSFAKESHHQIDKLLLIPGSEVNFNIYLFNKFSLTPLITIKDNQPVKIPDLRLIEGDLVISNSDIPLYEQYINNIVKSKEISTDDLKQIKSIALRENSKTIMKKLLEDPRSGEAIKKSQELVSGIVDNILENRDSIYDMLSLKNYDYYTYTHSVNVAVLSIGLGVEVGLSKNEIHALGNGALLHDIGKSMVPPEILNKQGKLDSIEYKIITNHVLDGYNIIKERKDLPPESHIPLVQHHEKLTGKGYPNKLTDKEIKLFGRITAIADCYDALTTQRPYKPAFTPFYALSVIAKDKGDYDPEILKMFIKMLGKVR
ncbi:MAG: HD-GYP domain-containing protein [Thermodesulfovibrionales bacterium]|nr:HD-GYP domain-containing protein [Thermodesulfovibrionales bacterium]